MTYWVGLRIGCLECGEDSQVLGIFTDGTKALAWVKQFDKGETYEAFVVEPVESLDDPKLYIRP
jgi:hypothetical protein